MNKQAKSPIGLLLGVGALGFLALSAVPATFLGSLQLANLLKNPLFIFVGIIVIVLIFSGKK